MEDIVHHKERVPVLMAGVEITVNKVYWLRAFNTCYATNILFQLFVPHLAIMEDTVLHVDVATVLKTGREKIASKVHLIHAHHCIALHIKHNAAICIPSCENGGICISPGHCACPSGFIGSRCEEGIIVYTL